MKTESKVLLGIFLVSVLIIGIGVYFLSKSNNKTESMGDTKIYQIDYLKGQKIGSESAKVKLVEFSDFQCPACKATEPLVKNVLTKFEGKIQFIYRHFPLPQHLNATKAAILSEVAAEEGKFLQVHDQLFSTQESWAELGNPNEFFIDLGQKEGIEENKIKESLEKNQFTEKINGDLEEGRSLGVDSTPTFYLNGKKIDPANISNLESLIESELK